MALLLGNLIGQALMQKVGLELGMKVIKGVTSSAKNISSLLGFIKREDDQTDLMKFLKQTDIEATIKILECIVSELCVDDETPISIINSLKGLHESLVCIETELKEIKHRLEYNRSLYVFKSLRSYGFKSKMKNLSINLDILANRKKLLFETIEISASLEKGHINNSILEGSWMSPGGKILGTVENSSISESKLLMIKDKNSDPLDTRMLENKPSKTVKKIKNKRNKRVTEKDTSNSDKNKTTQHEDKPLGYGGLEQSDISILDDFFADYD